MNSFQAHKLNLSLFGFCVNLRKGSVIADMLVVQDPIDKSLPAMQILENAVRRGNLGSLMVDPTFFVTKNGGMNNHKNHEHQAYVTGGAFLRILSKMIILMNFVL